MPEKRPLRPDRVRQIPEQFSWIDRGFVRRGLILGLSTEAIALYFFLVTVSDRLGMSFYSERRLCETLSMDRERFTWARNELMRAELIAWAYPLYQVLALPLSPQAPASQPPSGGRGFQPFREVLSQLGQSLKHATSPSSESRGRES